MWHKEKEVRQGIFHEKINFLFFIFIISSLFISCATTIETVKNDSSFVLKKDEGFILMKIINPNAGKIIDEFYYSTGETVKNQSSVHLNSDLQIKKSFGILFCFYGGKY